MDLEQAALRLACDAAFVNVLVGHLMIMTDSKINTSPKPTPKHLTPAEPGR